MRSIASKEPMQTTATGPRVTRIEGLILGRYVNFPANPGYPLDPIHLASTVTGATVFFLLGTPLLGEAWPFDPRSAGQLEQLRQELRRVTRRLLGLTGAIPRRKSASSKSGQSGE